MNNERDIIMNTQPYAEDLGLPIDYPPVGTRVIIVDGSEAHGDKGVVYVIENNLCLVELDQGCVWVVSEPWEIKKVKE